MAISQYSYKIELISGVDNCIADSMPRLCRNNMIDSPVEYRPQDILSANIIVKFKEMLQDCPPGTRDYQPTLSLL